MERNQDVDVHDGGYVRGGVGGGSTFVNIGVKFSSFFIPSFLPSLSPVFLLRTLCPSTLGSTRQFPIFHLLFYFFCALCATLFLITSPSLPESPLYALSLSFFFCLTVFSLSATSQQCLQDRGPECRRDMCLAV